MSQADLQDEMDLPLEGVRVLDLSRVLAGPLCGQVLADFGAEVIKVEHPGRGDDTRDWGMRVGKTETTYFNSVNRSKRSITLDLQTPEAVQIIYDLLPQFDVVISNFKHGGADKMGLGYDKLKSLKPDLIYCTVAGSTTVLAPPYRLDGQRLPVRSAPPMLGEGTREVLQQLLAMSDEQLQQLQQRGVLTMPEAAA